jgi:hypothetical protein
MRDCELCVILTSSPTRALCFSNCPSSAHTSSILSNGEGGIAARAAAAAAASASRRSASACSAFVSLRPGLALLPADLLAAVEVEGDAGWCDVEEGFVADMATICVWCEPMLSFAGSAFGNETVAARQAAVISRS